MKKIFGIHLQGGLGNMLFQILAGECLAKKFDMEVCYPNVESHFKFLHTIPWTQHCDEYLTAFKNIDWYKNKDRWGEITKSINVGFRYEEIIPQHGYKYIGYFQSEKNFLGYDVRYLLETALSITLTIDTTCSIHVRRTNYLVGNIHTVQNMKYYNRAMNIIKADEYYVFSDDMDWCEDNFKGNVHFIRSKDYLEMKFMSVCTHNIIANSSFSWLGAYMGNPEGRKVVAPLKWFNGNPDSTDIIPDNWIKI